MKIVGITGGTGSGKTTALKVLEELGARVIDCDRLYHELLEKNEDMKSEIDESFKGVVINGFVDRKKLGKMVFSSPDLLEKLNAITHKYVDREVKRIIEEERQCGREAVGIDAIALIESGLNELCDTVVGIVAPDDTRIKRIMIREGISEEYARLRLRAQKPQEWFEKNCDLVLYNNGTVEEFKRLCSEQFKKILWEKV
ncbi:MAG: dephospho-CoA kinase [Clostridiales bacterium]|nr:dephospho-CoA kinase [Clostridiales bacterium]